MPHKVTIQKWNRPGFSSWVVSWHQGGKRRRSFHATKAMAEAEQERLQDEVRSVGEAWLSLPSAERDRLMQAFAEARAAGVDLFDAIARAKSSPAASKIPTLADVITELVGKKKKDGRSDDYTKALKSVLEQFSKDRDWKPINQITHVEVEKFLDSKELASRSTLRARISTLFKFAVRWGYRADNPCDRLDSVIYHKPTPAVFTVEQFKTAVAWLLERAPHGLAWFALSTCCGLRPEEAEKTTKAEINFDEGFVRVEKQTTKVRQRRVVYPKAEAMRFVKWALDNGGCLPIKSQRRLRIIGGEARVRRWKPKPGYERKFKNRKPRQPIQGLRDVLGFKAWPKDITRHTAASYWLAGGESAAKVADMLGNSENVLRRDYLALVTEKEAQEFWKAVINAPGS